MVEKKKNKGIYIYKLIHYNNLMKSIKVIEYRSSSFDISNRKLRKLSKVM